MMTSSQNVNLAEILGSDGARRLQADERVYGRKTSGRLEVGHIVKCVTVFQEVQCIYEKACKHFLTQLEANRDLFRKVVLSRHRTKGLASLALKLQRQVTRHEKDPIDLTNLFTDTGITDLGGVRIVHLMRSDWKEFYKFITAGHGNFCLIEKKAYVRDKSNYENLSDYFSNNEINSKDSGYTSFHYILRQPLDSATEQQFRKALYGRPGLADYFKQWITGVHIEVQTRSLIEEGWSEIDHRRRYKKGASELEKEQLKILSDIANLFDGVASSFLGIDALPRRIDLVEQQQLEREADQVTILSVDMGWYAERKDDFALQVFLAKQTRYDIFYSSQAENIAANLKAIKEALEGAFGSANQKELEERVRYVPVDDQSLSNQAGDHVLLQLGVGDRRAARFFRGKAGWEEWTNEEQVESLQNRVHNLEVPRE